MSEQQYWRMTLGMRWTADTLRIILDEYVTCSRYDQMKAIDASPTLKSIVIQNDTLVDDQRKNAVQMLYLTWRAAYPPEDYDARKPPIKLFFKYETLCLLEP